VAFVINEPTGWCVFQGEAADVFANHRLKSLWSLNTLNMRLTPANLAQGIYTTGTFEYTENETIQTLGGPLDSWPNAANSIDGSRNSWTTGSGSNQRSWELETTLTTSVSGSDPPIFTQDDFPKSLSVTYAVPMPKVFHDDPPTTTTSETVRLERCPELHPGALLQQRTVTKPNSVTIETSFYWPKPPGASAGYTAPLVRWVETRITGLTTNPMVLTNYYSQTYRPGHHNFTEEFIFEPRLDPAVPPATVAELNAANIQLIHVSRGFEADIVHLLGYDGKFRRL
jgi:hypothetical protein